MDTQEFKDAAKASIDHIADYYENITDHSVVSQVEPGYLRKVLPSSAPQDGEAWDAIRRDIDDKIVPGLTHWQSPNFLAFFPCPSSYPSLLGELYSSAFTGACFNWVCSPAVTELETIVLDWLAQAIGLPATYHSTGPTRGGGVIQGSASEAVLTMMVTARDKYLRETLPPSSPGTVGGEAVSEEELEELTMRKRSRMVALGSAACHSSTKKAAKILGVRYAAVPVSSATGFAMTGPALADTLAACRARGWEPFFLTATLGTTDTCAVDDFAGIADVLDEYASGFPAADHDHDHDRPANGVTENGKTGVDSAAPARKKGEIWVHVDAAYAGAALVTPEAQEAVGVHHLGRFHSFNTNMHKWLLTNFDASCLFVTDRGWLEEAMSAELHVYRNTYSDGGFVTDYRNWQIPLGRRFRSLKVWFVLRSYGVRGLQAYIRRGVGQGEVFAGLVAGRADLFEVLTGPAFALTVFRMAPVRVGAEERRNELTRKLYEEVNKTGKIWVTGTVLEGKFAIRVMTGNRLTEEEHVRAAFELFQATAERIINEK
ncbi:hypothetical protein VMCG_02445 [Cytospora schulzeri]|uniref:Aromatic-L-amino-acid decarboxylase n=1 Tax=Cytospora schulzeri TaxID=448051 RepID=A0A423X117_9PEZI|nr:hypothetical protein VMCG_02445 [Valsa malicola]